MRLICKKLIFLLLNYCISKYYPLLPQSFLSKNSLSKNSLSKMPCSHGTCVAVRASVISSGGIISRTGAGILVINNYKCKNGNVTPSILLGKEVSGRYANQYNLAAGGMDKDDDGCYLVTVYRELAQEFKIDCSPANRNWAKFDSHFKLKGHINFFMVGKTPIFIGYFPGSSSTKCNILISAANANKNLPHCEREMTDVQWWSLLQKTPLNTNVVYPMSDFARSVIDEFNRGSWFAKLSL